MPLRALLRIIEQNEQVIQKLSDSYPIRQAAKTTVYFMNKTREVVEGKLDESLKKESIESSDKPQSFTEKFQQELKEGLSELRDELNDSEDKGKLK